jgi:hypothetical protein
LAGVVVTPAERGDPLSYILRRESDELYLELQAFGYREIRFLGHRLLERLKGTPNPLLVFTLPPQHFAETAIDVRLIPSVVSEQTLDTITLLPSEPSILVFRVPDRDRIDLTLSQLLAWSTFALVLPNLDAQTPYELSLERDPAKPVTRIELPWGIELTPLGEYGPPPAASLELLAASEPPPRFVWEPSVRPAGTGEWTELWTTALRNSREREEPNQFEILSVRGFVRDGSSGSVEDGTLKIQYSDSGEEVPEAGGKSTPLGNVDRIEIATSLSRRFPYTGKPGPPTIESAILQYDSPELNPANTCITACFADGRTLSVTQFRLSARGGWLELDSTWKAFPGCALTGWTHSASLGRDHHVKLVRAGFLYPFGTEAELVIISERAFIRDDKGHFVAVLFKQAFLQVPQQNRVDIDHSESMFRSVSITTRRTPPLDVPPGGSLRLYAAYDFFLPMVDGHPFEFEHTGVDWAGAAHPSRMPMFFVSNKARSANGLIWEPGLPPHTQQAAKCGDVAVDASDAAHAILKSGDGLRVVDKSWNAAPYRFAPYGEALIAMAMPHTEGDTSQRVEWAEWARGIVRIPPAGEVAARPFQPRNRVLKCRMQGISQFSGERIMSLATYRDTRFIDLPLLDPEPTASQDLYFSNVPAVPEDASQPYLFLLETRDLISEPTTPQPLDQAAARERIRALYFGTTNPKALPDTLFDAIDNEVRFGRSASSEATGGLAVPDTHTSTLTRRFGPIGDATFNPGRWRGYAERKATLEARRRLDYAAFRLAHRPQIDVEPFESSRSPVDIQALAAAAAAVMQFTSPPAISSFRAASSSAPQINLGEMFGADAQILPGLAFKDLFNDVPITQSAGGPPSTAPAAEPLTWNFRITGLDWLLAMIGGGPGQISMSKLVEMALTGGQTLETSTPTRFGIEASLDWSNQVFTEKDLGPVVFKPVENKTRMEIAARARMDLGLEGLPADLSQLQIDPAKARITSSASLHDFRILLFGAIEIEFAEVAFSISEDGHKDFVTNIRDVRLTGPLEFINQLSQILGGLGSGLGIDIDVSPARVKIGQTIRFPPTEGQPLFLGPAQIINLAVSWGVMIPLIGRDVLTASFALSSREKPLIIFVPPWYGGKAHVLLEVTTRGVRLLEVSMEYGALIPIRWGIASGEASLTAGIFFMVERQPDPIGGRVVFKAFVKAEAHLDVAGIIHFDGLIYIALSYVEEQGRKLLIGEAGVSVSIKIGFVRISYSFTATHVEETRSGGVASLGPTIVASSAAELPMGPPPSITPLPAGDARLFGSDFDERWRAAFQRVVEGYVARREAR